MTNASALDYDLQPSTPVTHAEGESPSLQDQSDPLLTIQEVARRVRVDTTTVRRWIATGTLEAVTLPHAGKRRSYRVRQSTLDRILLTPYQPTNAES